MRARTHPGKRAWTCDARGQVLNTKSGHMSPCSYYCTHTDYNISLRIQRHQKAACFLPSIDNSGVKQLVHPTPRPPPCLLLHHPRPTYPLSRVSLPQTFNSCRTLPHPLTPTPAPHMRVVTWFHPHPPTAIGTTHPTLFWLRVLPGFHLLYRCCHFLFLFHGWE